MDCLRVTEVPSTSVILILQIIFPGVAPNLVTKKILYEYVIMELKTLKGQISSFN